MRAAAGVSVAITLVRQQQLGRYGCDTALLLRAALLFARALLFLLLYM